MISLLAPSKTMNLDAAPAYAPPPTQPLFLNEASQIADCLKGKSLRQLKSLMHVSDDIAASVHAMYENWTVNASGKPALWAYKGDVYKGVKADNLTPEAAAWAQEHLLTLSGLYGLVRPFDGVQRYRLEMKAQLKVGRARTLYDFWGDKLAAYVAARSDGIVCCLSSNEYAKGVLQHLPRTVRVITPVFYDVRPTGVGTAPIYNKMMRGVVARWLIDQRVDDPARLPEFTGHGYRYDPSRSTPERPAYFREKMVPLNFNT